jgi:23S rRNA (uracil1939-C5)-methyltransferase
MTNNQNKKKYGQSRRNRKVNKPRSDSSVNSKPGNIFPEVVKISEMGHLGDGIATLKNGETCFIPYVLTDEIVKIERAENIYKLIEIQKESENRIKAFCNHFTVCGGCKIQQLEISIYQSWKHSIVQKALMNQGIDAYVSSLIDAHGAGRRRVSFHAKLENGQVHAGLMKYRSHDILNIDKCPILVPELSSGIKIARDIARIIPSGSKPLQIQLTATENGIDCNVNDYHGDASKLFTEIAELANTYGIARISLDRDIIIERKPPFISIAKTRITLPPSSFLQPTIRGENILASLVLKYLKDVKQIADLYCGIGTFAIRLAKHSTVTAYDTDGLSVRALTKAVNKTYGLKPVIAIERDLHKDPLFPQELKKFEAIVMDPPRAGAAAQAKKIAASSIKTIVVVSCNPGSFALDASILIKGGFVLKCITPVDQFKFTSHIELVALFKRP